MLPKYQPNAHRNKLIMSCQSDNLFECMYMTLTGQHDNMPRVVYGQDQIEDPSSLLL